MPSAIQRIFSGHLMRLELSRYRLCYHTPTECVSNNLTIVLSLSV